MERVLLVGNSGGVLNNEWGPKIDEFDIVVRFNNFELHGYEKYVGTKTTHVSLSPSFIHLFPKIPTEMKCILIRF